MSTDTPKEAQPVKPKIPVGKIALLVVGIAVVLWLGHFGYRAFYYEETDDAAVEGHVHQISSQIDGTVKEVLARDNQQVAAGDLLVKLDPLEFELMVQSEAAGLARAEAEEARSAAAASEAKAELEGAEAHLAAAKAQVTQAQVQSDLAAINRGRARQLFHDGGAVTQSDVDNAESAFNGAEAGLAAATANVKAAAAAIDGAKASVEASEAAALSAKANSLSFKAGVTDAQRKLAYASIVAPAAGRIGNRNAETGNRVQAGQIVLALVEPNPWIVANFKETQIARMHPGLPVDVTIDALPGTKLQGTIDSISPASGAQFALLPPDNATGNFTKVVQRLPVKILLDPQSVEAVGDRLRPGLSAVVSVRVR